MDEVKPNAHPDTQKKKIWKKPKCISGKDIGFFGMISSSTGPSGSPTS
jgi:hypothetical protein